MKKSILLFSLCLLTTNVINAQWWSTNTKVTGNNEMISQTRSVGNYDEVLVTGMMDVKLIPGKEGRIDIDAESNLMEYLETEVEGGKLKISVREGVNLNPSRNNPIRITVPIEQINAVALTGSGNIKGTEKLTAPEFNVDLTGSGDINLNLDVQELDGRLTGSGDVNLNGRVREFKVRVTGSGDFLASGLTAEAVDASILGSGDIEVRVTDELRARISGSGDIKYLGDPKKQDFKTTGSGSISKK